MGTRSSPARRSLRFELTGIVVAVLPASLALASGRADAEPTPALLDAAHAMIVGTGANNKGNDRLVLAFCYPAAKSLTKVEYLSKTVAGDGAFSLTYRYSYRDSDNEPADFQLHFDFSPKGKLAEIQPVANRHSSLAPPLSSADVTLGLVKETIRTDEKLKKEPVWMALLEVNSASEFLVGMMNLKAGK